MARAAARDRLTRRASGRLASAPVFTAAVVLSTGALLVASPGAAATQSQAVSPTSAPTLTVPSSQTKPPPRHFLSAVQAIRIAARSGKVQDELSKHDRTTRRAFTKGPGRWQVSWYAGGKEVAQATVDERTGRAIEVWTGPQVAWPMARGLPGAFGRKVNSPVVWIPLMVAFFLPFFDWRRPLRMLHLDLLVLLAFSLSQVFFNRGEIDTSVPLVYPVLAYLLARMLYIGFRGAHRPQRPLRLLVPVTYLALGLIFLVGFRVGLNLTNSNVIDVGYSGVIGADRITHGEDLYGNFPSDDPSGDTYGPVNYYAYVPFELAFPWSGKWDDLPAAHAAAIFFDLATMLALFWIGKRLRRGREGTALGVLLAYAWASYPYTLFVANSNANDSLVALLVALAFGALSGPRARGALLALASAAKFAPLLLAPLFASYDRRRLRDAALFALAFAAMMVLVIGPVAAGSGLHKIWDRTVGFQLGRDSPFSIWGLHPGLGWLQSVVKGLAIGLALLVALVPRRKSPLQLAALGTAVLVALQLALSHWFYLYIVWWLPLALVALILPLAPGSARSTSQAPGDQIERDIPSPTDPLQPSRSAPASA